MAHLDIKVTYQFQLDADEFRLLCKALSGTMNASELDAARLLHFRFQTIRAKNTALAAEACQKARMAAEDACTAGEYSGG